MEKAVCTCTKMRTNMCTGEAKGYRVIINAGFIVPKETLDQLFQKVNEIADNLNVEEEEKALDAIEEAVKDISFEKVKLSYERTAAKTEKVATPLCFQMIETNEEEKPVTTIVIGNGMMAEMHELHITVKRKFFR